MRGRSWKNAFVLLDEAQNATPAEIKTFLTRIGEDCTVVINGDVSQCDLDSDSGLRTVIAMIEAQNLPVPVIEFTRADIVRSGDLRHVGERVRGGADLAPASAYRNTALRAARAGN